jgi:hypothetical protein
LLAQDLAAAQLIVVAAPPFIVLAVGLLARVDLIQGGLGITPDQGPLYQVGVQRVTIRTVGPRRPTD